MPEKKPEIKSRKFQQTKKDFSNISAKYNDKMVKFSSSVDQNSFKKRFHAKSKNNLKDILQPSENYKRKYSKDNNNNERYYHSSYENLWRTRKSGYLII